MLLIGIPSFPPKRAQQMKLGHMATDGCDIVDIQRYDLPIEGEQFSVMSLRLVTPYFLYAKMRQTL